MSTTNIIRDWRYGQAPPQQACQHHGAKVQPMPGQRAWLTLTCRACGARLVSPDDRR